MTEQKVEVYLDEKAPMKGMTVSTGGTPPAPAEPKKSPAEKSGRMCNVTLNPGGHL